MKSVIVFLLAFLLASASLANELPDAPKPKKTMDKKFFFVLGADGLSAITDAITTERMLGRGCFESNTWLYGEHPSPGRLAGANAAYFAGEVVLAYSLKRILRKHRWSNKLWMIEPVIQTTSHAYFSYQNENLKCF